MPLIPLKASLIMANKFSCNLGIAEFIVVSMAMANNWLLTVERDEHQNIKCRDTKSNNLIFGFYKSVILKPLWGLLHPLNFI